MPPTSIEHQLQTLHAHYISRVNAAVAAGRLDLARELAADCEDEALDLMLTADEQSVHPADIEILELGGGLPQWPQGRQRPRRHWFWRHGTDR